MAGDPWWLVHAVYSTQHQMGRSPLDCGERCTGRKKSKERRYPDENLGTGLPEINPMMAMAQMRTVHTVGIE